MKGFTLVELLVVIAVIALLMAILMPVLGRVKRMARAVVCQSNLRQWGVWYSMYTSDNNGMFFRNDPRIGISYWWRTMRPYYEDCNDLLLCPTAAKCEAEPSIGEKIPGSKFSAWGRGQPYPGSRFPRVYGSYGLNKYVSNDPSEADSMSSGLFSYWRTTFVKGANNIPLFLDCRRWEVAAARRNSPPDYDDMPNYDYEYGNMPLVCIDRHDGHINTLFMDFSVRKVGLKELWTLNWRRGWDTANEWTTAGGVQPEDWPDWMRKFKDY